MLTKTTNNSPTENEVSELILIANNNPQKVKQFIRYKPYFFSFVGLYTANYRQFILITAFPLTTKIVKQIMPSRKQTTIYSLYNKQSNLLSSTAWNFLSIRYRPQFRSKVFRFPHTNRNVTVNFNLLQPVITRAVCCNYICYIFDVLHVKYCHKVVYCRTIVFCNQIFIVVYNWAPDWSVDDCCEN